MKIIITGLFLILPINSFSANNTSLGINLNYSHFTEEESNDFSLIYGFEFYYKENRSTYYLVNLLFQSSIDNSKLSKVWHRYMAIYSEVQYLNKFVVTKNIKPYFGIGLSYIKYDLTNRIKLVNGYYEEDLKNLSSSKIKFILSISDFLKLSESSTLRYFYQMNTNLNNISSKIGISYMYSY